MNSIKRPAIVPRTKREVLATEITGMYQSGQFFGKTCVIIAGGPSLKKVVSSQLDAALEGMFVIGVNKSFSRYRCDINYSMDPDFYAMVREDRDLNPLWNGFGGMRLFLNLDRRWESDPDIHWVRALGKKGLSFDLDAGIHQGNNSSGGAMMLACALGFKKIGFLGLDLKVSVDGDTHWHKGYGQDPRILQRKMEKFKDFFHEFSDVLASQSILVYNLNPDSGLTCFPRITLGEFLSMWRSGND